MKNFKDISEIAKQHFDRCLIIKVFFAQRFHSAYHGRVSHTTVSSEEGKPLYSYLLAVFSVRLSLAGSVVRGHVGVSTSYLLLLLWLGRVRWSFTTSRQTSLRLVRDLCHRRP